MGGFGEGFLHGSQAANNAMLQHQHLKLQKQHLDAQLKTIDLQNKLQEHQLKQFAQQEAFGQALLAPQQGTQTTQEIDPSQMSFGLAPDPAKQRQSYMNSAMGENFSPEGQRFPELAASQYQESMGKAQQLYPDRSPLLYSEGNPLAPPVQPPTQDVMRTVQQPSILEQAMGNQNIPSLAKLLIQSAAATGNMAAIPGILAHYEPKYTAAAPGSTVFDSRTAKEAFHVPDRPEAIHPIVVGDSEGQHVVGVGTKTGTKTDLGTYGVRPGQITNPVDQYVASHSNGKYRSLQQALDAGDTEFARKAEETVRGVNPGDRAIEKAKAIGGANLDRKLTQEPLPPNQAGELGVPYGTTPEQAKGLAALTPVQRENISHFQQARNIVADIEKYWRAIPHPDPGLISRSYGTLKNYIAAISQTDPNAASLLTKAGELSLLIRAMGEKGALANQDVGRGASLIPGVGTTTDLGENQIADLYRFFDQNEAAYKKALTPIKTEELQRSSKSAGGKSAPKLPLPPGVQEKDRAAYERAYRQHMETMSRGQ